MLNKYIEHSRNRSYMVGIERDRLRVKETAEGFIPNLYDRDFELYPNKLG